MTSIPFISHLNAALKSAGCLDIQITSDSDELYSMGLTSIELLITVVELEKNSGLKLNAALISQLGRLTVHDLRLALGATS